MVYVAPPVDPGADVANALVTVYPPEGRWIAVLAGPRWGPTPMSWSWIVVVIVGSIVLGRLAGSHLRTHDWFLLGAGLTPLPVPFTGIVLVWVLALEARERSTPAAWWRFDLVQLALVGLSLLALLSLYAAVHTGLLHAPDAHVLGNASSDRMLRWYADRVSGGMPQPIVVSFPRWVWRILMLAWSLWLVARLVRWLPWAWRALGKGGWLRLPGSTP